MDQARQLTLVAIPVVLGLNFIFGVWRETALLLILTWLYNDLQGGDEIVRNLIIAFAFGLYNHGSLQMATHANENIVTPRGYTWIAVISGVILTTMQIQDLKDQAGDRARGRKTIPLILGDMSTRWIISILVPLWSCFCVFFWNLPLWAYALPMVLGGQIGLRALQMRNRHDDNLTWKLWYLWLAVLYTLPLAHRFQAEKSISYQEVLI